MMNKKQGFVDKNVAVMVLILLLLLGGVLYILKQVYDLNREQVRLPSGYLTHL